MKKITLAASAVALAFVAVQAGASTDEQRAPKIDMNSAGLTYGVFADAGKDGQRDGRAPKIDLNSASLTYGVLAAAETDARRDGRAPKIDLNSA